MTQKFLKNKEKHTFHLVKPSQLPLIISIGILAFLLSIVAYFHNRLSAPPDIAPRRRPTGGRCR